MVDNGVVGEASRHLGEGEETQSHSDSQRDEDQGPPAGCRFRLVGGLVAEQQGYARGQAAEEGERAQRGWKKESGRKREEGEAEGVRQSEAEVPGSPSDDECGSGDGERKDGDAEKPRVGFRGPLQERSR